MKKTPQRTIAVLGANGKSGQTFVHAALTAGYKVRAGVHKNNSLSSHENLEVIHCDATKLEDVEHLLYTSSAVVSLIGHVRKSPPTMQTDAMRNLTEAMRQQGIRRIISLTGTGVRQPGDSPSLMDILMNFAIKLIDSSRITDGVEHVKVIQKSQLDWSVLRVLKLTSGETGQFSLSSGGPAKTFTSRSEVSDAILEMLEDGSFVREMPVISRAH